MFVVARMHVHVGCVWQVKQQNARSGVEPVHQPVLRLSRCHNGKRRTQERGGGEYGATAANNSQGRLAHRVGIRTVRSLGGNSCNGEWRVASGGAGLVVRQVGIGIRQNTR